MNNSNKEDLIEYLLNYAFNRGYAYRLIKGNVDDPSMSFKEYDYMIINTNWRNPAELPFIIGHEIGHLVLGEQGIMYYSSYAGQNSEEHSADLYALNLIYEYSCNRGDDFQEPGQFMMSYSIPMRMQDDVIKLFDREQ